MYCSSIFSRVYYVCLLDPPSLQDISHWPCRVSCVNIHSRVQLVCTSLSRALSCFPLVPNENGIWASPPETDQDSCPGWQPLYLVSLQKGFSPGPLTPRFKCFPATSIFPISLDWKICLVPRPHYSAPKRQRARKDVMVLSIAQGTFKFIFKVM